MENIQFENQYEITKKLVKSWNKLSQKRSAKHRIWINFLAKTEIAVLAALMLISICFYGSELSILVFSLLVLLFIFYSAWPDIAFKMQSKQFSHATGESKWIQAICFGENIEFKNGNTTTTYSYDKICFVDENDECFYLFIRIGSRLSIFHVYKKLFSVGNAEDFSSFIKEKCAEQESLWTKRELNKQVLKKLRLHIALWISSAVFISLYIILTGVAGKTTFDKVKIGGEIYNAELTELDLISKQISDISALESLKSLTRINMNNNKISDISVLEHLTNLTSISMRINQINDISSLKNLKNLEILDMSKNQINDISALKNSNSLTRLFLQHNQINDINALKDLINLTNLSVNHNQINDTNALNNLNNLEYLSLGYNQIIDINALKNLTNLKWLFLNHNQVNDISALKNLNNLSRLWLENNQISDISALKGLINLRELNLQNNPISESQLDELRLALPNCSIN